ncbi:MAG: glycoside hydrolase family 28 protein [Parcubacteria group bacterium]|jgi:polygalacturonase|nr:glycoside hydrolase family 28 protein [Candidatus Moranbacteria bacterium]
MKSYKFKNLFIHLIFIALFLLLALSLGYNREQATVITPEVAELSKNSGIPEKICDIRDYGAKTGTDFKSTDAINSAIQDCHNEEGGTVVVPKGVWLSGGIKLKSNINFFLEEGSEIVFSTDLEDYLPVVFTRFQGIEFYNFSPLIYASDGQNIIISGKGKLVGSGDAREDWTGEGDFGIAREKLLAMSLEEVPTEERIFGYNEPGLRPSFIQFVNCKDIILDGFTVENGPIWTIHPIYSENFIARNLIIDTWGSNTDGIVIDSTKNVIIENSFFSTGDDAIAIKSGLDKEGWNISKASENIDINNITVVKGNSGVSIGSEMSGGVANVKIRDSVFKNARHGFRIKSTRSRGGFIRDILVENIVMDDVPNDVIDINLNYSSKLKDKVTSKPVLKNIFIKDIKGSGGKKRVINIDGISDSVMENILFENILFDSSARAVSLEKARNILFRNIQIEAEDPTFEIEDSQNISVENSYCGEKSIISCFIIKGSKSKDIWLKGISLSDFSKVVEIVDGAVESALKIDNENLN